MYKTYIKTPGAYLLYESDVSVEPFFEKNGKFLDFPGIEVLDGEPNEKYVKVIYHNSRIESITCNEDCIEIYYPFEELTEASIVYMGYILMEKMRAEKSMVTLHSACVEKEGVGTLLLGRAGSGKTTTALSLCTQKDYSLIGNDRNVIGLEPNGDVAVYGGTKFIFLRYESIARNLPHLTHMFADKEGDTWLKKKKVMPNDINISACYDQRQLFRSYIVHVDNSKKELHTSCGDTPENRLYLNEISSMYIRGIYTTFCDKKFRAKGYIPSYDSEEYYYKRAKLIEKIITDTNLEYVSGSTLDVANYIDENNKKLLYTRK